MNHEFKENEQGGEIVVIGEDSVKIQLKREPCKIDVFLKEKNEPPPCNPDYDHHYDHLEWSIGTNNELNIKWNVHEYREIVWTVWYKEPTFFERWLAWMNWFISIFLG